MKKYSLLICCLAAGLYTVAQKWEKNYDRVDACNCGLALVAKAGKFGFVTDQGKIIVPLIYDEAVAFSEDKAAVAVKGRWGFIDKTGNEFVKPQYSEVYSFHEGLAVVGQGSEYSFIDTAGKVAIQAGFTNARSFEGGLAPVCNKKRLWGYIDKNGREVIPFRYNYATTFTEGVARVLMGSKWYSIDTEGTIIKEEK